MLKTEAEEAGPGPDDEVEGRSLGPGRDEAMAASEDVDIPTTERSLPLAVAGGVYSVKFNDTPTPGLGAPVEGRGPIDPAGPGNTTNSSVLAGANTARIGRANRSWAGARAARERKTCW